MKTKSTALQRYKLDTQLLLNLGINQLNGFMNYKKYVKFVNLTNDVELHFFIQS